jgi:hypothetical protein
LRFSKPFSKRALSSIVNSSVVRDALSLHRLTG